MEKGARTIDMRKRYIADGLVADTLLGAAIGDITGSKREGLQRNVFSMVRTLFPSGSRFTDDTVLSMAVAEWLMDREGTTAKDSLLKWGRLFPHAGYGRGFKYFQETGESYVSTHNGAAMRVSPVGIVAKSIEECLDLAAQSAAPTHDTKDGTDGACAVALAIFLARQGYEKDEIRDEVESRFGYDLRKPSSFWRDTNKAIRDGRMEKEWSLAEAAVTVPQAIVSFLESEDYVSALKIAISTGGDTDTVAAIAGSIAASYYGVPRDLVDEALVYLPSEMIDVINRFEGRCLKPTGMTPPDAHRWTRSEVMVYGCNADGTETERGHAETVGGRFNRHPLKGYGNRGIGASLDEVSEGVREFISHARQHPEMRFHVRELGCEKGGFSPEQIAPLFVDAVAVENILLPKSFVNLLLK